MTEAQWLHMRQPMSLWAHKSTRRARKLRLFCCACCRRVAGYLPNERAHAEIELIERFADGLTTARELTNARARLNRADKALARVIPAGQMFTSESLATAAVCAAAAVSPSKALDASHLASGVPVPTRPGRAKAERSAQADLFRDIFGNPFRPVAFDPNWRTETAVALASGIYAERAFDRLPILADALEDAGCDERAVLGHCRKPKAAHVRGCWVVDLVLGKE